MQRPSDSTATSSHRRMTMGDLARLAGVSIATVSRALRNVETVLPETRKRVQKLAAEHGFVANANAQNLRGKTSRKIGVVIDFQAGPGRTGPDTFMFELLADVVHALTIRDYEVSICPRAASTAEYEQQFAERGLSGAVFLGQSGQHALLQDLTNHFPIVVWGAVLGDGRYCSVGSDNFAGGRMVGRHFRVLSATSVLLVGDKTTEQVQLRFKGFREGFDADESDHVDWLDVQGFSYEGAYQGVRAYLARGGRVDAIFAATDTLAMAAIRALQEVGLAVPGDVRVAGYNDIPQSQAFHPSITTVREDSSQAGSLLADKLLQVREGMRPTSARLAVEFIERES